MLRCMLRSWLQKVAEKIDNQAEAARVMEQKLGRSIDRAAVNKMLSGGRNLRADEAIVLAELSGVPLPTQVGSDGDPGSVAPDFILLAAQSTLGRLVRNLTGTERPEVVSMAAGAILQTAQLLQSQHPARLGLDNLGPAPPSPAASKE